MIINVQNLTKSFDTGAQSVQALKGVNFSINKGEFISIMGPSGSGKTTLMNAINNGKLEGWPSDLRTEYVDSGSNVDPVHEAKIVFTHLLNATNKTEEECKAILLDQLKFTPEMMKGSIGELSGGWQMKLRLAQAVLIDADILLLDEPIVTTGYYSTATLIQTSNPDRIISYIERCSYSSELSLNSI